MCSYIHVQAWIQYSQPHNYSHNHVKHTKKSHKNYLFCGLQHLKLEHLKEHLAK